ncbi:helix-turn-helix domain-containing protein [Amycolatopsis samaneae]|uniref:Helix-turn-helix transcriptional regulator n=1 Tax=Amycolatopsis samaneae TaxID=664691 RepID=A0ABW5G9Q1_9PSEU
MTRQPPPSESAQELGKLIRAARNRLGLKQKPFGAQIGYSQSQISKFEKATAVVPRAYLEKIIDALRLSPEDARLVWDLSDQAAAARKSAGYELVATPEHFHEIYAREQEATAIHTWRTERVSGLLQCESYMTELFQHGARTDIDEAIHERKLRSELFAKHPGRAYEFLLSQSTVDRLCRARTHAGPVVALDQLKHMLALLENHPSLTILIVPLDEGPLFVPPDFHVLRFDDPDKDFVYTESLNTVNRYDRDAVAPHLALWRELAGEALDAGASRDLLREAAAFCARRL